jgi:ribosomal peptide maturation radical SAM protein 1
MEGAVANDGVIELVASYGPLNERAPERPLRIALVNMPFAAANRPSIQCGILKAELQRFEHKVDTIYLNIELAAELGAKIYGKIADLRGDQFLGDWLFSAAAFGDQPNEAAYRAACPSVDNTCEELGLDFGQLCSLRNEMLPALVDRWLNTTDWSAYDLVGFTSTFEQNAAAFALARRIKAAYPAVKTVFGGANFDGEMGPEYLRAFGWIDYVVVGEGDVALPALANALARGDLSPHIPGVVRRGADGEPVSVPTAPLVRDLDALPDPNYDEYFSTLGRVGREKVLGTAIPLLLFESSRGCWWGQKHHCTFCGLNNNGMSYRSKTPAAVRGQLRRLSERYRVANFASVDNIIDMRYLDDLCRPIAEERLDYNIFYEVKANLSREQLHTLRRGGVTMIQPGIESLSTHILTLMRKGTTMLRNVCLLKWAHYYGMQVQWNLITGFPGETRKDYTEQCALLPLLFHLPPPNGIGPVWLERFSPYFTDPSFPVRNRRPRQAYHFIYPPDTVDLEKTAYFFEYEMDDTVPLHELDGLRDLITQWRAHWASPSRPLLLYQRAPDWLQIVDRRDPQAPRALYLHGVEALAYELCGESDHKPERIAALLAVQHGIDARPDVLRQGLRRLCDQGLMVEENDHFLSLAMPANANW